MRNVTLILMSLFSTMLFAQEQTAERRPPVILPSIVGRWDSQMLPMQGSGDPVDFTIAIQMVQRDLRADLLNGPSRIAFSKVVWQDPNLTLTMAQYEGVITAHCADKNCDSLVGQYERRRGTGTAQFKFVAKRHPVELQYPPVAWQWPGLDGDWRFSFDLPENDPDRVARARFTQGPAEGSENAGGDADLTGTIAPLSGDFGLLHGRIAVENLQPTAVPKFRLTRFDGIHVMSVKGLFMHPDQVIGTVTFSFGKPINFKGERISPAPEATATTTLPNPETVTTVKNPAEPFRFEGIDPATGKTVTSEDARFKGKPVIIDIFGTWCPNCHDEAPLLADIYNRYRAQGLEMVGLSYEYVKDDARSARLLKLYKDTYAIEFPLLIAGTTDEGQIAQTLPELKNFKAYPTTIFLDKDGKVHAIHAGFAGPATGNYEEVKARFEKIVQEIVK